MDVAATIESDQSKTLPTRDDLDSAFDFLKMLLNDHEAVSTDCVKKSILTAIHKTIEVLRNNALNIYDAYQVKSGDMARSATPECNDDVSTEGLIYADYIDKCNTPMTHCKITESELINVASIIIRKYSLTNDVIYENDLYLHMIPSYNDTVKAATQVVDKMISAGSAGLTTKFDVQDRPATFEYTSDEINSVKLPESDIISDDVFAEWSKYSDNANISSDTVTKPKTCKKKRTRKTKLSKKK